MIWSKFYPLKNDFVLKVRTISFIQESTHFPTFLKTSDQISFVLSVSGDPIEFVD